VLRQHPRLRDAGEALIAAANEGGGATTSRSCSWPSRRWRGPCAGHARGAARIKRRRGGGRSDDVGAPAVAPPVIGPFVPDGHSRAPPAKAAAARECVAPARSRQCSCLLRRDRRGPPTSRSRSVYFIGTNGARVITLYPASRFKLPGQRSAVQQQVRLGVSASTIPSRAPPCAARSLAGARKGARRALIRSLELGQLE